MAVAPAIIGFYTLALVTIPLWYRTESEYRRRADGEFL